VCVAYTRHRQNYGTGFTPFGKGNRYLPHVQCDKENRRQVNTNNNSNYMQSSLYSSFLKTTLLIASLVSCVSGSTIAQSTTGGLLSPRAIKAATLDYRTELAQGYLKVYSATDEYDDGGLAYYAHSSYAIYTTDGKLFKTVENHISCSDESPELVTLPAGSYVVIARSDRHGDVAIRVAIQARQLTVLDLDLEEGEGQRV
jgi:hypothetical protein